MTTRPDQPRPASDWTLYQEIIERARKATGLRQVAMTQFDSASGRAHIVAISFGIADAVLQRALTAVRKISSRFDPAAVSFDVRVNPLNEQVYLRGETVQASLTDLAGDIVPHGVLAITAAMTGTAEGLVCPLIVRNEVFGAIGFNSRGKLTNAQRLTCEAFAAEVALTLENRLLEREITDRIAEMERVRQELYRATPLLNAMHPEPPQVLSCRDLVLDTGLFRVTQSGREIALTPKEFRLLAVLLRHAEQPVRREHLSQEVWGYRGDAHSNYVDVTIMHLRKKLEAEGAPRLIHAVRGFGYVARA